jgi:NAD(P)-dependent dehydrogenase (short-subunit alcohol dehydrogenase family)
MPRKTRSSEKSPEAMEPAPRRRSSSRLRRKNERSPSRKPKKQGIKEETEVATPKNDDDFNPVASFSGWMFPLVVLILAASLAYCTNTIRNALMSKCQTFDIPPQKGKVFVVTGASSGLGLETARVLAKKGGKVIMGCRSMEKCASAKSDANMDRLDAFCEPLEMSSLKSVKKFAESVISKYERIDVLVNNAGLMNVDPYQVTNEGVEMTVGVNHLAHFYLTQLLLPYINENGRIVTHSSLAAYFTTDVEAILRRFPLLGSMSFLRKLLTSYNGWKVYGDSKLANAQMSWELSRRLRDSDNSTYRSITSYVVHPGYTSTNLQKEAHMVGWQLGNAFVGMNVQDGAQTQLLAAGGGKRPLYQQADAGGRMLAPVGYLLGYPSVKTTALDDEVISFHLWQQSLKLCGINESDDVLPPTETHASLVARKLEESHGGHIRTLFQKLE